MMSYRPPCCPPGHVLGMCLLLLHSCSLSLLPDVLLHWTISLCHLLSRMILTVLLLLL
uniref:N-acetylneuraminate synthase n=1 Tax=uncultured marine virus TaxID=186617 RepID=A0A0F7LA20_9VIRU|nr:N-acetylneuraminate synthase [uncultured marine virus]